MILSFDQSSMIDVEEGKSTSGQKVARMYDVGLLKMKDPLAQNPITAIRVWIIYERCTLRIDIISAS